MKKFRKYITGIPSFRNCLVVLLFVTTTVGAKKNCDFLDVYGTDKIDSDSICEALYDDLNKVMRLFENKAFLVNLQVTEEELSYWSSIPARIKTMGPFESVVFSPVSYIDGRVFITIDVVETKDAEKRSNFYPNPQESISDVAGLIEQWDKYAKLGYKLFYTDPKAIQFTSCPGFHCLYGFEYPAFKKYGDLFVREVPLKTDALIKVLQRDKDVRKRGTAVYLLAYTKDIKVLLKALRLAIRDPNALVRNNVMRVLESAISENRTTDFPLGEIMAALDFPSETDRNKALYIVLSLVERSDFSDYFAKKEGSQFVKLLKMRQPNIHDVAYQILKKISRKDYGEHDYVSWNKWAEQVSSTQQV